MNLWYILQDGVLLNAILYMQTPYDIQIKVSIK